MTYQEFLESKVDIAEQTGIEVDPGEVNPALKPHQRDAVLWALRGGRRALFESFGLGKTVQQLEWARLIVENVDTSSGPSGHLPLGGRHHYLRKESYL